MLLLRNVSISIDITSYIVINLMGKFTTLMVILGQIQTLKSLFSFAFFFKLFVFSFIQVELQSLFKTSLSSLLLKIHYKYKYQFRWTKQVRDTGKQSVKIISKNVTYSEMILYLYISQNLVSQCHRDMEINNTITLNQNALCTFISNTKPRDYFLM